MNLQELPVRGVDVAVIGNGPSGIMLSTILSGYLPYYSNPTGELPNAPFLHDKLSKLRDTVLLEDFSDLAQGLDGRSLSPTGLLFDALFHPGADLNDDSIETLLDWRYEPERSVSHVVFGSGDIGGTWAVMQDCSKTLSKGDWMNVPAYTLKQWAVDHDVNIDADEPVKRGQVGRYYQDAVRQLGIEKHFVTHCEVSNVEPMQTAFGKHVCGCNSSPVVSKLCKFLECTRHILGQDNTKQSQSQQSQSQQSQQQQQQKQKQGQQQGQGQQQQGQQQGQEEQQFSSTTMTTTTATDATSSSSMTLSTSSSTTLSTSSTTLSTNTTTTTTTTNSTTNSTTTTTTNKCKKNHFQCSACSAYKYLLTVNYFSKNGEVQKFYVPAQRVVVATGQFAIPRRLGVPGEHLSYVKAGPNVPVCRSQVPNRSEPLLVVGGGLSAADAVVYFLGQGYSVIHLYIGDKITFGKLNKTQYPEYAKLHSLMKKGVPTMWQTSNSEIRGHYFPINGGTVARFLPDRTVSINAPVSFDVETIMSDCTLCKYLSTSILQTLPTPPMSIRCSPVSHSPVSEAASSEEELYSVSSSLANEWNAALAAVKASSATASASASSSLNDDDCDEMDEIRLPDRDTTHCRMMATHIANALQRMQESKEAFPIHVRVQQVLVLIGFKPNISFLGGVPRARNLVTDDELRNLKHFVDPITSELTQSPGVYVIGSLGGDTFVRFVLGSAFATAGSLFKHFHTPLPAFEKPRRRLSYGDCTISRSLSSWLDRVIVSAR